MLSYSQAGQDIFVIRLLKEKVKGIFLEIGAYHPTDLSNSYLLESKYDWKGICIDIDEELESLFNSQRKCFFISQNAVEINYKELFDEVGIKSFDYISFDVDKATLQTLKNFPLKEYPAAVITYEHDCYGHGDDDKNESRKIFEDLGYVRLCSDVKHNGNPFEDWYYNPRMLSLTAKEIKKYTCEGLEYTEILEL